MKKILIIGCGLAGLSCAIQSAQFGNHSILVSPAMSERSQSVLAQGGINAVIGSEHDSPVKHAKESIDAGCCLENRDDILRMCLNAPANIAWLESMGTVFTRNEDGRLAARLFGGQSMPRTVYSGSSTGKQIMTALIRKAREYENLGLIERKTPCDFHSLLIYGGKCCGALILNEQTNQLEAVYADAVVIASGGQQQLFGKTTGSRLNDGYVQARLLFQGVKLRNLEFIQYHPTAIETAGKYMLISEAARAEGGRLFVLDDDGNRIYFMEDKYGTGGNLMPRDIVSKEMYLQGRQVYLDMTGISADIIDSRLTEISELCQSYIGLDIKKDCIPVKPAIHYFMGGIKVDSMHRTNIENLYAAGECASKYHGANRLGGNSLMGALFGGRVCAHAINLSGSGSEDAADTKGRQEMSLSDDKASELFAGYIEKEREKLLDLAVIHMDSSSAALKDIAEILSGAMGIVRDEQSLFDAWNKLGALSPCPPAAFDSGVSLYEKYRREYEIILAKAVVLSAYTRKESRGAHIRKEFPSENSIYELSSVVSYAAGRFSMEYSDDTERKKAE